MSIDKLERNNQRLDAAAPAESGADAGQAGKHGDAGASRQYAEQLAARFQAYVDWAIDHWPLDGQALDPAAFERSREDLTAICRRAGAPAGEIDPGVPGGAQFLPVTPMPWP
ncbi:MAG TPA: hypothetical protein VGN04_08420 [Herbaspirillum sp.]